MNRTHILTATLTAITTLGVVGALGFAQPDGIDPPAGSVSDTQPSLTSIDQKLDSVIGGTSQGPFKANQFLGLSNGASQTLQVNGAVLIKRVIMQRGRVLLSDTSGQVYRLDAGGAIDPGGIPVRVIDFSHELDIELTGPLTLTGDDGQTITDCIIVYKELP